ncbi:MAG: TMEM175 family protein [Streptosporangiaceae bacterium]|jgi:uncharacterized membrane protein
MTSEDPAGGRPDRAEAPDEAAAPDDAERSAGRRDPVARLLARSGNLEFDRVLFFSDAVFAIAITVLAIDLRVPIGVTIQSGHELHEAIPGIESFAISFVVIGLFWLAHHSMFRFITAFDRPLMFLNLLLLGTIAFLPFPTAVLGASSTSQAPAVIFYAACVAATGLLEVAAWLWATRPGSGLAAPGAAQARLSFLLQAARSPVIFLLSIPIALVSPTAASLFWIALLPSAVILRRLVPLPDNQEPAS